MRRLRAQFTPFRPFKTARSHHLTATRAAVGTAFAELEFAKQKSVHARSVRMKTVLAASTTAILTFSVPAFSQTSGAGPDAGGIPESMRIQQQVDRQNSANPQSLITKPGATTTDAPGAAPPPVEQNRLDPSAPSRQRLQIDEGASARAIQNPGATTTNPNAAGNFNTIIEGAPSSSGTSSGVSGAGTSSTGTGVLTSPSGSTTPSLSPSISSGVSRSSGARTSSGVGGASSSSGSSAGGASAGGGGGR